MAIDPKIVGNTAGPVEFSWTSRDTMLYALGVGAGQADPYSELQYTTENSDGVQQVALPVYAVVIIQNAPARPDFGAIDRTKVVHAEQAFELHRPLPVAGSVRITSRITDVLDKGSGALITIASQAVDRDSGAALVTSTSSIFVRGAGGFGGPRGASASDPMPTGKPDFEASVPIRPDQALLYRLSGDRNPLHSDPKFAARGGFPRPILHGMCTYGVTGRILLNACCDGKPERLRSMSARFTKPVLPGDTLTVQAWRSGEAIRFRTLGAGGDTVLDQGTLRLNAA